MEKVLVLMFSLGIRKNSLSLVAIFMVLLLALLIGIAEEYIFRGLILGGLVSSGKSVGFALIVSSLLFACTHFVNLFHNSFYNVGLQVLYVIPMGLFTSDQIISSMLLFFMPFKIFLLWLSRVDR